MFNIKMIQKKSPEPDRLILNWLFSLQAVESWANILPSLTPGPYL